uniref:ADAM metallopeptidase domain 8 n=1 Tax=Panthera tigris altaica TaxID=74533 RepID=A0A8C9KA58_PANTA
PVPGQCELCPWGPRAQLHPALAEEQGAGGLGLHGDLQHGQRLPSDRAATEAETGSLLLPGPRGGARAFCRQPQHLCRPQVGGHCTPGEGGVKGRHALYQAEHLQQKAGTCGVSDSSLEKALGPRISAAFRPRVSGSLGQGRYAVRRRVLEVVNHVDRGGLYQELNVRVVLVGLEIWNHRDGIHVSSQADTTLENFLTWRAQKLAGRYQHDNAQLITGVDFTGTTVGLAKVSSMCSRGSGAVNQVCRESGLGLLASGWGARFRAGAECVKGKSPPSPSVKFPRMFSQCSRADLELFVEKPRTGCLDNAPDPGRLVGDPVCGNWFVEHGEQCDCGPPQDCRNPCCNATTCQLAHGAECAQGELCSSGQVTPAGELCRHPKDACDLEEHCDGRQPGCPEDAFQENGTPCPGGYCYNGACPTLAQRCQDLWGPGSRVAVERCYTYSISPDCKGGIPLGSSRVNKCGVLYCEGGQKPPEQSSCTLTSSSALVLEEGVGYEPVPEGTKCGEERVCNHKEECQCHPGWAPPHCTELLPSVHTGSRSLLMVVLVPAVLLVALALLAGAVIYRKSCFLPRTAAPKTAIGLSNRGPPHHPSQPARPAVPRATPKQPPPAPPAATSKPPSTVPVYTWPPPDQGVVGPKAALKPPVQRR